MKRARRVVFFGVSAIDQFLQTLAAREDGSHLHLLAADLDYSARLFQKSTIPATFFEAVRAYEDTPFGYHHPNADDAMRLCSRANAEDLGVRLPRQLISEIALLSFATLHPSRYHHPTRLPARTPSAPGTDLIASSDTLSPAAPGTFCISLGHSRTSASARGTYPSCACSSKSAACRSAQSMVDTSCL